MLERDADFPDPDDIGFLDYLQVPLQPLGDNLESQTYETFERDPVKYARYEVHWRLASIPRPRDALDDPPSLTPLV